MVQPFRGDAEGEAHIDVHANVHPYEREIDEGVKRATDDVDADLKQAGDKWGKTTAKSMGDRLEKEGPSIAERFQKVFSRFKITKKVDVDVDKDRIVRNTRTALEGAFEEAAKPGGILSKFGQGVADAIGAGFNVSGKSPLVALLVPLIGAIVGLVVAAVQAVSALGTLLASLPVLLGGIAAQVGVLVIAFQGMGTAIQGAFAAKNAKELNEALKGLTPSAQAFVRELLPLRDLFRDIRSVVQENFFKQIQGDITSITKALGPLIKSGLGDVAAQLGNVFHLLAGFLNSPLFQEFVEDITGSTVEFLKAFGPGLTRFLDGLIRLAIAATPLLDDFGKQFSSFIANAGRFFSDVANSAEFQDFLEDMGDTFFDLFELIDSAGEFLVSFMGMLNQVGGNDVIKAFSEAFQQLAFFFQTPIGEEGLKAFIDLAIFSIKAVAGLIELFFTLLAAARNVFPAIAFYFEIAKQAIIDGAKAVGRWFSDMWKKITDGGGEFVGFVKTIPEKITNLFKNAGSFLLQAGRNILEGLIQGIRDKLGPLNNILDFIGQKIRNFFPFSPAKEGPLSGQGDPRIAGGKIVQRLGEGMHMEIPSLRANTENVANNITFGAGAIQQNFNQLPTVTQAQGIGAGVGAGIADALTVRDARLRVRVM